MPTDPPLDEGMAGYLKDALGTFNTQLPRRRKSLAQLLEEEHPHVRCKDGNAHFFKREELEYLSGLLDLKERDSLLLPILLEVSPDQSGTSIRTDEGIEARIFSKILCMPVVQTEHRMILFRPQLTVVRKILKTTTQYVFTFQELSEGEG